MSRIAFLHLNQSHEDCRQIAQSLHAHKISTHFIDIRNIEDVSLDGYDLIDVRNCRGYHLVDRFENYIDALQRKIEMSEHGSKTVANNITGIKAALDKYRYLPPMENIVPTIPTRWVEQYQDVTIESIMLMTGWNDIVLKPTMSSRCWSMYRVVEANNAPRVISHSMNESDLGSDVRTNGTLDPDKIMRKMATLGNVCVQKFMPSIMKCGEVSFIFIDGEFSHSIQKMVNKGGWLAHEAFGAHNTARRALPNEVAWARCIYDALESQYGNLSYARIDGLYNDQELPLLLECEFFVPRLFLREANAVNRYVASIIRRLSYRGPSPVN